MAALGVRFVFGRSRPVGALAVLAFALTSTSCGDSASSTTPLLDPVANEGGPTRARLFPSARAPSEAPDARFIPLTLAAYARVESVPVKSGLPLPRGAVSTIEQLRLESADGAVEVPAQFDMLAAWPDGSVKAALVQFVAHEGDAKRFRVAFGKSVRRGAFAGGLSVTKDDAGTVVDTGVIKVVIDTRGRVEALWRDTDHNGVYDRAEQVLGGGEIFMVNAFDDQEYTSGQAPRADVTIEEQGPIRAVVRVRGTLANAAGVKLVSYLVRYSAYAGSDKLDIEFTVIDDRVEADVSKAGPMLALSSKGYGMRWKFMGEDAARYRFGLEGASQSAQGSLSGEHHLLQNGAFLFDNGEDKGSVFKYSGIAIGRRAPGWLALDSDSRHLALMVRDFWQQYPAELGVEGRNLTVSLFAERSVTPAASTRFPAASGTQYRRPNTFYFLRPGGAKTHQMRLAFASTAPDDDAINRMNSGYQQHRLELMADPSWYASSGVFGEIDVGDPKASSGYSANLLNDIYIPSIEAPRLDSVLRGDPDDRGGDATMYGWRDYGDRLRAGWNNVVNGVRIPAFYNDTHVGANNFFHEFVRTGEQRWFGLGELSTRHFADIDVAHSPRKGYWDRSYAGMGQQPPGEIHAIGHNNEDHQTRNMHWGHAHVSGLSDYYLLTGDKRSLEVLTEIAAWWRFTTPYFFKRPFDPAKYREAERDYGWPLYVMNEYVRVTGDADYHRTVSAQLVNYLIEWWQTPLRRIGYDPRLRRIAENPVKMNDANAGTGYWTMTLMDNAGGTRANGTNPWMAGPLLSNLIRFYEIDAALTAAGKGSGISPRVLENMLFQCMNYVVKYGYDNDRKWFVYSEAMRQSQGGHTMIDFPLAYLDRLYKKRLSEGNVAHPGWYDTQARWSQIAQLDYDELVNTKVGASTQAYGFYGYEFVYPVDFFRIMNTR